MFAGGITPCHDENGGYIENYEIERGDRQDGGRLTFVPGKSHKILCISRMKEIRKNRENVRLLILIIRKIRFLLENTKRPAYIIF